MRTAGYHPATHLQSHLCGQSTSHPITINWPANPETEVEKSTFEVFFAIIQT
jgi:hypothetical protein